MSHAMFIPLSVLKPSLCLLPFQKYLLKMFAECLQCMRVVRSSFSMTGNPIQLPCSIPPSVHSAETDIAGYVAFALGGEIPDCIGMCSCGCAHDGNVSFISVDCSSRNLSVLPDFLVHSVTNVQVSIATRTAFMPLSQGSCET